MDKVARNLPLSEGKNSRRLIAPSVAIQSNRVDPGSFTGMSLAVKPPTADPNKLTSENMVNDELPMADVQTSITLPEVIFENKAPSGKAVQIGFVIYQNDKFFQPVLPVDEESGLENTSIVSRVISSSVKDMTIENLTKPVELVFEPAVEVDTTNGESVCAFWDFDAMGKKVYPPPFLTIADFHSFPFFVVNLLYVCQRGAFPSRNPKIPKDLSNCILKVL